ncbi:MAG: (Fe-S)-binding protein [Gammaproteobacteria bacterium]|nr:(Fe-S)-binding protein [Gammaproteobacteria bacterium]
MNKARIGLFVTCLVDLYRPSVAFAAIKLLEDAGYQVEVPEAQTCCGQPAFNSGDFGNTREIARQVIDAFADFDYVVGASGSCIGTIRAHYPDLFENDPAWLAKARDLSAKTYELTSFLTDIASIDTVESSFRGEVTYHDSCSGLRELGVKQQPRKLLDSIDGVSVNEMQHSETCCGFGGTFCVKFPEISTRLASDKVDNICDSRAPVLLGGDLGCLLNISGRLQRLDKPVRVFHVAEVLADMADGAAIGEGED